MVFARIARMLEKQKSTQVLSLLLLKLGKLAYHNAYQREPSSEDENPHDCCYSSYDIKKNKKIRHKLASNTLILGSKAFNKFFLLVYTHIYIYFL